MVHAGFGCGIDERTVLVQAICRFGSGHHEERLHACESLYSGGLIAVAERVDGAIWQPWRLCGRTGQEALFDTVGSKFVGDISAKDTCYAGNCDTRAGGVVHEQILSYPATRWPFAMDDTAILSGAGYPASGQQIVQRTHRLWRPHGGSWPGCSQELTPVTIFPGSSSASFGLMPVNFDEPSRNGIKIFSRE